MGCSCPDLRLADRTAAEGSRPPDQPQPAPRRGKGSSGCFRCRTGGCRGARYRRFRSCVAVMDSVAGTRVEGGNHARSRRSTRSLSRLAKAGGRGVASFPHLSPLAGYTNDALFRRFSHDHAPRLQRLGRPFLLRTRPSRARSPSLFVGPCLASPFDLLAHGSSR